MYKKYRKHPRVIEKKSQEDNPVMTIGIAAAIGVVVFAFLNGMVLGCTIKRK